MIILTINNFMGDEYQFSIPDTSGLVISEFRGTIPLNTRKTITAPFKKAALNDRITINDLNAAGRLIFSLLPDEVQDYLNQNQNEPVLFQTNDSSVPWELCHNGTEFQELNRPIGRIMILPSAIKLETKTPSLKSGEKPSVLIIANPTRENPELNLPEADKEAESLASFLDNNGCKVNILAGKYATRFEVMSHLQGTHGEYDIIHFAGHAKMEKNDGKNQASLTLADGPLTPIEIRRILRGSPIVFLNACHTVSISGMNGNNNIASYTTGSDTSKDLAEAFIIGNNKGNARALIGTLFRNDDTRSHELAKSFYNSILEGETFGEALRFSRHSIYSDNTVTWASYMLYGDPRLKLNLPSPVRSESEHREEKKDPRTSIQILGDTAKEALLNSLRESGDSSFKMLITPHLLLGMASLENGYTQKFFNSGPESSETILKYLRELTIILNKELDISGFSNRINNILTLAVKYAKRDSGGTGLIEEKHLLQAFFTEGGGFTSKILEEFGLELPVQNKDAILNMALFKDKKQRTSKFSEDKSLGLSAKQAIDCAFQNAQSMGHPAATTPHLLVGVLTNDKKGLGRFLQQKGIRPSLLKKYLYSVLVPGQPGIVKNVTLTHRFHDILYQAAEIAGQAGDKMEAKHIAMAILNDGFKDSGSITMQVLIHSGIDPKELLAFLTGK